MLSYVSAFMGADLAAVVSSISAAIISAFVGAVLAADSNTYVIS